MSKQRPNPATIGSACGKIVSAGVGKQRTTLPVLVIAKTACAVFGCSFPGASEIYPALMETAVLGPGAHAYSTGLIMIAIVDPGLLAGVNVSGGIAGVEPAVINLQLNVGMIEWIFISVGVVIVHTGSSHDFFIGSRDKRMRSSKRSGCGFSVHRI